jgi:hypothetical protein
MLERDMMVRAIKDLEKKSGITAERIELTAEEAADSDKRVSEKQNAEAKAEEDARYKLEADAAPVAAAEAAPAAAAAAPAADVAVPAPAPSTPPAQA